MSQISKMYLSETSRMEMDIEYTAHYDAQLTPRGLDSQQSLLQTALNKKAFAMDISRELIDDGDSDDDDNESAQSPDYYSPAVGALPTSRIDIAKSVRDNMGRLHVLDGMSIPETQEAEVTAIMGQDLSIALTKIDVKRPPTGEVIVRVAWTGMCRSDACFSVGPEPGFPSHNHIAGHEGIGNIVASYDKSLLGRPVAMRYLGYACQSCRYCRLGTYESCPDQKAFPKHHSGCFQQYMTVPWSSLLPLPEWVFDAKDGFNPAAYTGALCSGSAALKAAKAANIRPRDTVVVVGAMGGIGHLVGQMAKHVFGAKVVGVDLAVKVEATSSEDHSYCCDRLLPSPTSADDPCSWDEFQERLRETYAELNGDDSEFLGADSVIVTASSASAFNRLDTYVRDGGSIICVGCPRGGAAFSIPLVSALVERQLKVQGTMMGGSQEVFEVLNYIRSGVLKPGILEIGLGDVPKFMQRFLDFENSAKVVVRLNGMLQSRSHVI